MENDHTYFIHEYTLSLSSVADNEDDSTADSDAISWADHDDAGNVPGQP